MTTSTLEILKSVLTDDMNLGLDPAQLDETTCLFEDGLDLDSIVLVELIGAVEQRFAFQFDDADLRTSSFKDLGSLVAVIEKYRG